MKKIILLSSLLFLSCSLLQKKEDPSLDYIDGQNDQLKISLSDLEEALTQYESMAVKTYQIKATILTPALLKLRGSHPDSTKTCFQIFIKTKDQEKYAYLKEWKGRVFVKEKENTLEFPLEWTKESLEKVPQSKGTSAYYGQAKNYFNEGLLCSETAFPMRNGFTLKLLPSFVQWPFDETVDLVWDFINPQAPEVKKIKERYRGW